PDLLPQAIRPAIGQEVPTRPGRDDEARWHRQSEVTSHDAEVRCLATHQRPGLAVVGTGQLVERIDTGHLEIGPSWSARHTRSGVSGSSRITTPVASRTAAATAGATG